MLRKIKIGNVSIKLVLRHCLEKKQGYGERNKWKIGIWFSQYRSVGRKGFENPSNWVENLVRGYMLGMDLLIVTMWIDVDFGSMEFKSF